MKYTENFNLNLPETTDQFRVDHQNENMRKIEEELYQLVQNATQTDERIEELKKSGSDGKALVADAITDLGITTATNASFETIAANVTSAGTKRYNDGVNDTKVGNAAEGDVVAGKTFTSANGVGMTGTIPDRSNTIQTATTDTSDQSKSCFCINGTNVWVVPAKGLWNNWNWAASRITLPASSLGITADKIIKDSVICGVTGNAEFGIGELPLPITTFTATVQNTVVDLSWTLPTDSLRSGVEIWYKKTNSFGDTPSGTKAYDSNTMLGTTATSCSYDFAESETEFYATIYSYAYINNQRCYTKGKTIQFHTKQVKGFTKILTSGTFTVPAGVTSVDVCLVGGGYNGSSGKYGGGGNGGSGGKICEIFNISVTANSEHTITIGNGNGGATLFDSYTSADGSIVANGGTIGTDAYSMPYGGKNGKYAFDDSSLDGIRYGAGGGAGAKCYAYQTGGSVEGGAGGTTGGGAGGNYNSSTMDYGMAGYSATANTGSGGGGGSSYYNSNKAYGGSGGSGICIIRWGY